MSAQAGWYRAPDGTFERWWDGDAWTEWRRPFQPTTWVTAQYPTPIVTSMPTPTSHVVHLILTILTCGLWAPVWIVMVLLNRTKKQRVVTRTM